MGLFQGMPGIGVPRDPSEASHLGLLSWAVTACLDLLIRLQVGLGSYSGRRPQQETRGETIKSLVGFLALLLAPEEAEP